MSFFRSSLLITTACLFLAKPIMLHSVVSLKVLHVVGDSDSPSPADSLIQARLSAAGLIARLADDDTVLTADADSVSLVILEESCSSSKIEFKFKSIPVPVVNMEPFSWDIACFIDTTEADPFGLTPGNPEHIIEMSDVSHFSTGLTRGQKIKFYTGSDTTRDKLNWGRPTGDAFTIAVIPENRLSVIFGYDKGAKMAGGFRAPEKRIAYFLQNEVADSLTDTAWQLFYSVLNWCLEDSRISDQGNCAFVSKNIPWEFQLGDLILWQRLLNQQFNVHVVQQNDFFATDYSDTDFLVISESADYGRVPDQYHFGLPTLNCEYTAYHMTMPWITKSLSEATSLLTDSLCVEKEEHPITMDFSGTLAVSGQESYFSRVNEPGGDVHILCTHRPESSAGAALFVYEKGAALLEGKKMAARFVAMPVQAETPQWANSVLWKLWDRSLDWMLEPDTISVVPTIRMAESIPELTLFANYPNPFNASTVISYYLPAGMDIELTVCDMTGRHLVTLVNAPQKAGKHSLIFDGQNLSSGLYLIRFQTVEFQQTRRMLLLK